MRRVQLYLDDVMNTRLSVEAARQGVSRASLIRAMIARDFAEHGSDPIDALIGNSGGDAADDIDTILHGDAVR